MAKKDEIFNAAISLFLEKGYSNVTVTDICDKLGITKPTFYKYINAKEELVLNLYDYIINDITSDTIKVMQADSNIERLAVIFNQLIDQTISYNSDLVTQMFIANLNQNHHSFDLRKKMTELCVLLISKAQKYDEINNKNNPALLYQTIAFCFRGYEAMWCINKGDFDLKKNFFRSMLATLDIKAEYLPSFDKYIKNN